MSSPSSQQSHTPSIKSQSQSQAIIAAHNYNNQEMSDHDEEKHLLNTNSDEEAVDPNIEASASPKNEVTKTKKSRYLSAPFLWFISASTLFPLIIIISIFIMRDVGTPFSLAFVLGIVTCIFGGCYFIPYMKLKDSIISHYKINQKKRMHVDKMSREIKTIRRHQKELQGSKEKIMIHNKQTKEMVKNLQMMNVDSLDELNMQKGKAQKVYQEWLGALLKKERILLHTLYDRFEFLDDSPGMTKKEFDVFIKHLPDGYSERMDRLGTFDKLSNGQGIILYNDFKSALDVFAEMELNDTDIDFEIENKETGVDEAGNKKFINAIVKKSTKARRMVQNKWFAKDSDQKQ